MNFREQNLLLGYYVAYTGGRLEKELQFSELFANTSTRKYRVIALASSS